MRVHRALVPEPVPLRGATDQQPMNDDGWGPVERGGGSPAPAPPRPPETAPPGDEPGGFGPAERGRQRPRVRLPGGLRRPRLPGTRGLARVLLSGLLVLVLAVLATGTALALYTSSQIKREAVGGLRAASGQMNVLIVGNDSREGLTDEQLQQLGTEGVAGDRTDTVFLLSVSGGRAALLSFPRDLYVQRCDGSRGRINSAYGLGGPTCLVETVSGLSGIPVSHYAEVNFLGFMNIVDAVGGVTVYFEEPFVDRPAGVDLPAGCQRLDGRQAIGYVRARTVDSDLGRIARQQRFIAELADEVLSVSTVVNVPRLFATAGAAGRSLTASDNLSVLDLLRLARAGRGFAGAGLATYTVPGSPSHIGGAAVLVPDESAAGSIFASFRDGSVLRPAPEPPAPPGSDAAPDDTPGPSGPGDEPPVGAAPPPADC